MNANDVPSVLRMVALAGEDDGSSMGPAQGYVQLCSGCHGLDRRGDGVTVPRSARPAGAASAPRTMGAPW